MGRDSQIEIEGRVPTGDEARTAFWANAYNKTVHEYLRIHPVRGNLLLHPRLFTRASCLIEGTSYTANQIEHGLLRGNRRAPLTLRAPLRRGDPRLISAPATFDVRIHFALNCGARSCPPIREYTSDGLDQELDLASR